MTVEVDEEPIAELATQAHVSIAFTVDRVLEPIVTDDGITFREERVAEPWVKDYDAIDGNGPRHWATRFDVAAWGLLVARENGRRLGGAVVAHDTPDVDMLEGRRDLAVLWDLRVHPDHRGRGVGTQLWQASAAWARARGCRQLKVETQTINAAACRFYERMGCTVGAVDPHAYAPELPDETQVLWYCDL